ncbi:uncharacterized protein BJ171DRAFT_609331 [Polychytrium aggregatum]|uniref:uncharacterized protein n=1 Tax=Polychytrium aggregatum TaxID=110093 RepID=UPI0022FDDF5D|nr:uncharacterized protein BJ171DRAFT_609331 [Polychytrium aggregatum]KAI9209872.1 hypothetical protein BJ171DRAFT_609331 [Polychytrium aggregatum]
MPPNASVGSEAASAEPLPRSDSPVIPGSASKKRAKWWGIADADTKEQHIQMVKDLMRSNALPHGFDISDEVFQKAALESNRRTAAHSLSESQGSSDPTAKIRFSAKRGPPDDNSMPNAATPMNGGSASSLAADPTADQALASTPITVSASAEARAVCPHCSVDGSRNLKQTQRLGQLERRIQQLDAVNQRYKSIAANLLDIDRSEPDLDPKVSEERIYLAIVAYLAKKGLTSNARSLLEETRLNYAPLFSHRCRRLKALMDQKHFEEALTLINETAAYVGVILEPQAHLKMVAALDDLKYIISKYLFVRLLEIRSELNDPAAALQDVLHNMILPHINRELAEGGSRGKWFAEDHQQLKDYLAHKVDGITIDPANLYLNWQWEQELRSFWAAAASPSANASSAPGPRAAPLYTRAIQTFFPEPDTALTEGYETDIVDLGLYFSNVCKLQRLGESIKKLADIPAGNKQVGPDAVRFSTSAVPTTYGADDEAAQPYEIAAAAETQPQIQMRKPKSRQGRRELEHVLDTQSPPPPPKTPSKLLNLPERSYPRRAASAGSNISRHELDEAEQSPVAISDAKLRKMMPPSSERPLGTQFVFEAECGKTLSCVKVMDCCIQTETNDIMVCTAGTDDRSDRRITIWNLTQQRLETQLDNLASKQIVALAFHPTECSLLLSADLEFDIKLWDWRRRTCLLHWRKMHTRIINKISWVPRLSHQAISCSSDQTLKIFDTHRREKKILGSLHANEPFTSFAISDSSESESSQILVASLPYSIRIYCLRSLGMLRQISIGEIKLSKTPITSLALHPEYPDFALLSCGNQLKLFHTATGILLKTYSAREIGSETRIEGQFSPCGSMIYSGTADTRSVSSQPAEATLHSDLSIGVLGWKLDSGKSERLQVLKAPAIEQLFKVTACKWIPTSSGLEDRTPSSLLVTVSMDNMIRLYSTAVAVD